MRSSRGGRALAQTCRGGSTRSLQHGHHAENQCGHERRETGERQDRHHEFDVGDTWNHTRPERSQQVQEPRGQREPNDCADGVEDECFDGELPHQPAAARAERGAHENLGPAHRETREQQTRDIATGDQQYEQDRREEKPQRGTDVADRLFGQRGQDERRVRMLRRIGLCESGGNRRSSAAAASLDTPGFSFARTCT